ncbi:MAG: energy-coupling factor ABC transporter permease [Betaproteobacteria bacterium]
MLLLPVLAASVWSIRRRFLPDSSQQHAWLAGVVCISLLWLPQVKTGDGVYFGMLGAALFALIFGWARAILGLSAALVLYTALTEGAWSNLGINGLLFALLPTAIACAMQRLLERKLPKNVFVFIIGNGMFVTFAATAVTSLAMLLASLPTATPAAAARVGEYVTYSLLLAWGEALVSGMIFSSLVIFRPGLVLTYREEAYLPRRG